VRLRFMFHYHTSTTTLASKDGCRQPTSAWGLRPWESAACGCNKSTNNRDKVQQSAVACVNDQRLRFSALQCSLLRVASEYSQIIALRGCIILRRSVILLLKCATH
jgi:hypothetical protein